MSRSDIDREACAWIAQLDGARPTTADIEAFREWVNRSPRHRAAIERLSELWGELNVLTELAVPQPRACQERWRPWPVLLVALASLAVVATALIPFFDKIQPAPPVLFATSVGEQRGVTLPDGSSVQLNTASQLRVAYSEKARELYLLEGEGYFEVAHDPGRPFIVWVDGRSVRAVGTAFSLRRDAGGLKLLVTEGIVELAEGSEQAKGRSSRGGRESVLGTVKQGQMVHLAEKLEAAESLSDGQMARELAWRQGMVSFAGEPLSLVIDEISRYTETRILIEDPALRNLRIGGYFRAGDTEAMLDTMSAGFPIEVERLDESTVLLRQRH
ncbi:MAG: FecR domain-containing protein [Haliea sp.]